MRRDPEVEIAPSTFRGRPTGPQIHARARLLDPGSPEDQHAAKLLRHKHPFLQGMVVPLTHRLMRTATLHYEVRPLQETAGPSA